MSPIDKPTLIVGVALSGTGWHPAAWREADATPTHLSAAQYWVSLVACAETAGLDFVTLDDALHAPSDADARDATQAITQLDALLTASWVAPHTSRIGLLPTVTVTHTEPFHVATALQTLDHISAGRGGAQLRISGDAASAAAFGRRAAPKIDLSTVSAGLPDTGLNALLDEAAEFTEVLRRLWVSWDVDAEIRDVSTGRFLDRDRVHPIRYRGEYFEIEGASIVSRSPQGELPVTVLSHAPPVHEFAATSADVVFVTPESSSLRAGASRGLTVREVVAAVRNAETAVQRARTGRAPLRIVADLVVSIDTARESGAARLERLNVRAGESFESDACVVAGSAARIADVIEAWGAAGIAGVRLRPLTLPGDLHQIGQQLLPELRARGRIDHEPHTGSLRERFGLTASRERIAHFAEGAA